MRRFDAGYSISGSRTKDFVVDDARRINRISRETEMDKGRRNSQSEDARGIPPPSAWNPFTPEELSLRLAESGIPWGVVGGWAIDLWLGRETREHEDLEIAIPRRLFPSIRNYFPDLVLFAVGSGLLDRLGPAEVHPSGRHQTWLLDEERKEWRVDIMLEPGDTERWIFRRDESIWRRREEMIDQRDGVPFLRPEGVLLYKAKALREKDQQDFRNVLPTLDGASRHWLATSLQVIHPGHEWISVLTES